MVSHPAKYTDSLLPILAQYLNKNDKVLDPFAGTGKIKTIFPNAILLEIEPEWATIGKAIVADSQYIPFLSNVFDVICTSPTYGNRMADHFTDHQIQKKYKRNTYRHALGRPLNSNNSGKMQWGEKYKILHKNVWKECKRVLKPNGIFILNISDHIRAGKQIHVSEWHENTIKKLKFIVVTKYQIKTPRQKYGQNSKLRVNHENIYIFKNIT